MSRSRAVRGYCPGPRRKIRYPSRKRALQARDRAYADQRRNRGGGYALWVYRCPVARCGGSWHLTSTDPASYGAPDLEEDNPHAPAA